MLFTESALWSDSVYKSQCPSVCVCVCMYVPSREVPFKCLFAPIYKGPRSIFFRFWDSLGKSYRKEVVSDFAILARKWSKIAARIFFFGSFLTITILITWLLSNLCLLLFFKYMSYYSHHLIIIQFIFFFL